MLRQTILFLLLFIAVGTSARTRTSFDENWLFTLGDDSTKMLSREYDDSAWRQLDLPHDWAIEGDFSASNPSGASGGALPGGIGWYRKHFTVDASVEKNDRLYVEFDGIYMLGSVYVNGHLLGTRPYGYSSVCYDITDYVVRGEDNVIAVRVDNANQPNSRWYAGCGIYRHTWLTQTNSLAVAHWGTNVQTTVNGKNAEISIVTTVSNSIGDKQKFTLRHTVLDADGRNVGKVEKAFSVDTVADFSLKLKVKNVNLWSPETPYIYTIKTEILQNNKVVDQYKTTTGARTFSFDANTGFWLNGKNIKINGVCQHHDLGCLGAALNNDALHRQLRILKEMGVNAIRSSHNPSAPELIEMADTMGFIIMTETFDMWHKKKSNHDYATYFDEWHERDLTDLIMRDRNHPSILMWSIGNEVLEQWNGEEADNLSLEEANRVLNFGHDASTLGKAGEMNVSSLLTKKLADMVRALDPTRPVTAGCNEPDPNNNLFLSNALDIIGFNYHETYIKDVPQNFPNKPFIMTESVSALASQGYYSMPSDSMIICPKEWWIPYTDPSFACSSYDNCHVAWGTTQEGTWDIVKHTPWCSGQFIWTGFDYIGEPTPYNFPARSSYFGLIDLAGFPKDTYYLYKSEWCSETVLYLFPHWNWIEGQDVDLWCYYNNADEVELFVNGQSAGVRRKADEHTYHVSWRVPFEKGEVKVVSRKDGKEVASQVRRTAGAPDHIVLSPERTELSADGKSLCFVTVEVVDKDGVRCPWAENQIFFSVEGDATIAGVDNGSPTSMERFKDNKRRALAGRALVVVQAGKSASDITLRAQGVDIKEAKVSIVSK